MKLAQLRGRLARPEEGHPVQLARSRSSLQRGHPALARDDRRANDRHPVPDHLLGMLSAPLAERFPGRPASKVRFIHTGLWPKRAGRLAGKRVGVVGIGATGIQVIQTIADRGRPMNVFVRTPQYRVADEEPEVRTAGGRRLQGAFDEFKTTCPTPSPASTTTSTRATGQTRRRSSVQASAASRSGTTARSSSGWPPSPRCSSTRRSTRRSREFVRGEMRARLKDPEACDLLIPTDYGFGTQPRAARDQLSRGLPRTTSRR